MAKLRRKVKPSAAVLAARSRKAVFDKKRNVRMKWAAAAASKRLSGAMRARILFATHFLGGQVARNLSTPVEYMEGPRGGTVVIRSKPGEFPRAETTMLMKSIIVDVKKEGRLNWVGYVGTPLDYGVILEQRMRRSFLKRTLKEMRKSIAAILRRPLRT